MKKWSALGVFALSILLTSCGDKYRLKLNSPKKIAINKPLNLKVVEKNNKPIDSVIYYIDGLKFKKSENIDITQFKLGKHAIRAVVYFNQGNKQLNNTIYFLAAKSPSIYGYKVVNTYPHDASAFTQGLEFHNGFLYESTGQHGSSSLRKVVLKTGKVIQKIDLGKQYFGEGMTIFKDKIYMLTWQKKIGFVYNLNDFKLIKTFNYGQSKEGWGLTHNEKYLIKSDGTEQLWFLDPLTLKEISHIEAYTDSRKAEEINELEYIKGKIYANVWQKNTILIINSKNGTIEGLIDLTGLNKNIKSKEDNDVLNGIAYDKKDDKLFVTGKDWDKVYEIKIFKKQ